MSIQQRHLPHGACFGCGTDNPQGLQLSSYPSAEGVTAVFTAQPYHGNGLGSLNGGIISTLLDCHSAAAAMHEADQRGWPGTDGTQRFVTATLDVRFKRPAPVGESLDLLATVTEGKPNKMFLNAQLLHAGKQLATATSRFVRLRPPRKP